MWYIARQYTAPVIVTAQALTDSRERKSRRRALLPRSLAGRTAFSAVCPTLVKTRGTDLAVIIHRAFYKEAAQATAGIVAILVVVFVLFGVTAALGRTVAGEYAASIVLRLIGLQTLRRVDLLLPLGFYLGVLLTFSRWYRDSEMTVLAACGIGVSQLLRPVLVAATLLGLLVAGMALYVSPLVTRAIDAVKAEGGKLTELTSIEPGVFTEVADGTRILYVERVDGNGGLEQVFLNNPADGRPRVVLARTGYPFIDAKTGDRFVALVDGWAYEGRPGEADYRVVRFEKYSVRLQQKPPTTPPATVEGLPMMELLATKSGDAAAEWQWRISKPLMVWVLALYGVVLAYTDARRGRLANLFIAILVYFVYSNLIGLGQTLIRKGQVPSAVGLWWVHASMLALVVFMLYRRSRNRPLWPRLRWARAR